MRITKVLTDFSTGRYTDPELNIRGLIVVTKMTGNTNFPSPYPASTPALAAISMAQTDFQTALIAAAEGGRAAIVAKEQKRAVLEGMLQQLAIYVNSISAGDAAKMLSSGFKVSKQPVPVGPLPKPSDFSVIPTGIGTLVLSIDPIDGASSYHWELQRVGSTDPKIVRLTTTATEIVTGLVSLQQYECKVVAVGADKTQRTYSDPIIASVL